MLSVSVFMSSVRDICFAAHDASTVLSVQHVSFMCQR